MNSKYKPNPDRYWAAEERDAIASAVLWRWERYQERLRELGRVEMWRIADRCYHGRNPDGGYANSAQITFGGEQGEVAQIHAGHFRRLVGQMHTLATSQRPAIEVTATSNDPEAVASTQVGRQVLDYDLDDGGLEEAQLLTHEIALVHSEGYCVQTWDFHAGELAGTQRVAPEIVDPEAAGLPDGEAAAEAGLDMPVREGAVRCDVRHPIDVARDLDLDRLADQPWYIVRVRAHKWELAARFPESSEIRQAILDAPGATSDKWGLWDRSSGGGDESDFVVVLTLYHMPTDALTLGRIVEVVGDMAISDAPYHYDHCVVHRDVPSAELMRAVGYGASWDLLALSQALDAIESGILSVADAGALVNWVAPRGQHVDKKMLDGGMRLIEYDDDGMGKRPPELAERPEVRDSDFKLSEHYQGHMRALSGINDVVLGDPQANVKSGNYAALIASMAVQANNGQQRAYAALQRSVMTGRLKLYQTFATVPRIIEMTGRDKQGHVDSFTGDRLKGVRRVRVELANPLLRTLQGKAATADSMLEKYGPEVITPDRYFALLDTGRLDDLANAEAEHKVIARRENDLFRQGQGARVQSLISDHHACHIREHLKQLNDASVRLDPAAAQHIMLLSQHVTAHAQMWAMCPPPLLAATGQQPAPMMAPPDGPPGPPGPGGPEPGPPMPPPPQAAVGGAGDMQVGMPSMPTNPATGEQGNGLEPMGGAAA